MEPRSSRAVLVTDRRWRFYIRDLALKVERAMRVAGCGADVVLTDDRTVRRLNFLHRGRNKATNVLTYEAPPEIFLAFGVVRREAAAAGRSVAAHVMHLLVHGALHLRGYEHEDVGEARRMEAAEARLLARLKVANPWKNK